MPCNLFALCHCVKQLFCAVLWVRGHKSYYEITGQIVYLLQKRRKICAVRQCLAVGVYVLTEQGNILAAGGYERLCFFDYLFALAASLTSSDIGNDAVAAKVVAAVHYRQPALYAAVTPNGEILCDNTVTVRRAKNSFAAAENRV